MVQFLEESSLLGEQVMSADAAIELLERARASRARRTPPSWSSEDPLEIRVKAVEAEHRLRAHPSHQAHAVRLPGVPPARARPRAADRARRHARLRRCASATRARARRSFEALRAAVMTVAQKGIKLQRFKGLGEMNADQLGETTMAPGDAHARAGHARGRRRRRPHLLDADGRPGRAAPRIHRGQRPRGRQPGCVGR